MSYHAACRGGVVLLSLTAIFNPQQTPPVTTPLFRPLITDDMHTVDRIIRSDLHSDVVLIRQVAEYIIGRSRLQASRDGRIYPHRHPVAR